MDLFASKLHKAIPAGALSHEVLIDVLKEVDPSIWTASKFKMLSDVLPDPVQIETLASWLYEDVEASVGAKVSIPAPISVQPPEFYINTDSIYAQLEPPKDGKPVSVRLLDSDWLLQRADKISAASNDAEREKLALPRRQELEELHPEAYMSVDAVREASASFKSQDKSVRSGIFVNESLLSMHAMAVGSVSHAWLTPSHPDPLGEQLVMLATIIRKAQQGKLARQQDSLRGPFQKLPMQFALFYDWASLCQAKKAADGSVLVARSPDEDAAFMQGLQSMQIWYAHQKVFAFLITELPIRCSSTGVARYDERGWTTVERAWTMLAKTNSNLCFPMIYDIGTGEEATRSAPLHPERIASMLRTKRFTSRKADLPVILRLYHETILSVFGGAELLTFQDSGWDSEDALNFAQVLRFCTGATKLYLQDNNIGNEGCAAICAALKEGALPNLSDFNVNNNNIRDHGCLVILDTILEGALPNLKRISFSANPASPLTKRQIQTACEERGMVTYSHLDESQAGFR